MKIKRFPHDPGISGWNAILPRQDIRPVLEEKITADWIVIGAGFAGLAAARRLAQLHPGDKTVLLEARHVAAGPAGRNSGFMIDLPHDLTSDDYGGKLEQDRKYTRLNRCGIDFAIEAASDFEMSAEALATSGKINAAASEKGMKHNADYSVHLNKLGEPHELLDAEQMRDLTGSSYYSGGLFTPGTAIIQPALFVRSMATGVVASGVSLYENSTVVAMERRASDWIVQTPKGSVTAPKVILAVNGHIESFGFFQRRLVHIYLYGSMTRRLTEEETKILGGEPQWGFTPADPIGTTVRKISGTGGDRIVVRNRVTYDPSMTVPENRLASVGQTHDRSFRARFPMLKDVTMEYRWGGQLCLSRNSAPAFGEVDTGLYAACCQNGLGAARGTTSGKLAAELASGVTSPILDDMLSEAQPCRIPPEPFASIGANAIMRWGEYRAGQEL